MSDRVRTVFSEQEVGEIVRRAVELQEQGSDAAYQPGVTRPELERIAQELGLDPQYLDRAIRESLSSPPHKGPLNLMQEFERVVDGELRQEDFDVLLEHLKPGLKGRGITQVGRTLSGPAKTGTGSQANVEVSSRNGRTKIRVTSSPILAYLIALHPAVIGSLVAIGAFGEKGMVGAAVAATAGLLIAGGLGFRHLLKLGHQRAKALADTLAGTVEAETQPSAERAVTTQGDEIPARLQQGS